LPERTHLHKQTNKQTHTNAHARMHTHTYLSNYALIYLQGILFIKHNTKHISILV